MCYANSTGVIVDKNPLSGGGLFGGLVMLNRCFNVAANIRDVRF